MDDKLLKSIKKFVINNKLQLKIQFFPNYGGNLKKTSVKT